MTKNLFIFFVLLIAGCGTAEKKQKVVKKTDSIINDDTLRTDLPDPGLALRKKYFMTFFKKFKSLDLPLTMRLTNGFEAGDETVDILSGDTLFAGEKENNGLSIYGRLSDTSNFYAFIIIYPADGPVPVLFTYSKDLKLISKETLLARGCGADCGMVYCSSTSILEKDMHIYCADTNEWYKCDAAYNEIPGTRKRCVEYVEGKIFPNGKVQVSELKEKKL